MLVSVIIASKDYGKWINDAVDSVIQQDYPHKRICITDDGSQDDTTEVITRRMNGKQEISQAGGLVQYYGSIAEVPVILNKMPRNHGRSAARNLAIKVAWEGTDIFGILDADDMYQPGRITKSLEIFRQHPEVGCCYTDYETLNAETGVRIREFKKSYSRDALLKNCIATNACFISKKVFAECGLYDESFPVAEDYELFLRISQKFLLWHIPESTITIRVGSHNSSNTVKPEVWQESWKRIASQVT